MKVYLIVYPCEDGVHVCATEVDREKADKLYAIFHDNNDEVYLEEYDTEDYAELLSGDIPYCVFFYKSGRPSMTHLATGWTGKFPHIDETRIYYRVHVRAASKEEAYQKAVVIHRDYVTK